MGKFSNFSLVFSQKKGKNANFKVFKVSKDFKDLKDFKDFKDFKGLAPLSFHF